MTETAKPITLHDWEVLAFLDGRKTQLRRPMEPQPAYYSQDAELQRAAGWRWPPEASLYERHTTWREDASAEVINVLVAPLSPFPVDTLLWVRETWAPPDRGCVGSRGTRPHYKATDGPWSHEPRWHSPITMPCWASRMTLRVKSVKVERVQEISHKEALAEGVCFNGVPTQEDPAPRDIFRGLWDRHNKQYAWDKNPWVWCIEVERVG